MPKVKQQQTSLYHYFGKAGKHAEGRQIDGS